MAKILIKEVMKEKNIKARQIIPYVPFSRATFYRILNGKMKPSVDDLEEFAKQLKVPLENLYESEFSGKWF